MTTAAAPAGRLAGTTASPPQPPRPSTHPSTSPPTRPACSPHNNLVTNVNVGRGDRPWKSGGNRSRGAYSGELPPALVVVVVMVKMVVRLLRLLRLLLRSLSLPLLTRILMHVKSMVQGRSSC
mgnify:CR=1 FL=1